MKSGKLQEKILFSRLKYKDKEAFVKVYDLYIDSIYRFVYFKIGHTEEAQDLTSLIFLKAWNYVQEGKLGNYGSLKPLLYKIARNAVIDHYRKSSPTIEINIDDENIKLDLPDEKEDIIKKMEIASDMEIVQNKFKELKDEYREVIILRFIDELSVGEIAEILDKPKGNVRVLVFRALKSLRDLLGGDK